MKLGSIWIAFILSLFLHMLLFFGLFLGWPFGRPRELPINSVDMDVLQTPQGSNPVKGRQGDSQAASFRGKELRIQDLMPSYGFSPQTEGSGAELFHDKEHLLVGRPAAEVGRVMGFKVAMRESSSLAWLHSKIDGYLGYPEELILYDRQGKVTVEFDMMPDGLPRKGTLEVRAGDHVLKVYVLWVLDKALTTPLPETKQLHQPLRIHLTFDFLIVAPGYYPIAPEKISKNRLNFIRINSGSSWVEAWQKDEVLGANLRLQSIWKSYINFKKKRAWGKVKFDPLEKYKRDPRY